MVSTNDKELYKLLLSIRSHGWDRDLPDDEKKSLREKYGVDDFRALYTFYYPGFNLRSTDLQAFLGLKQLEKVEYIVEKRNKNFTIYNENLPDTIWKIQPPVGSFVSNFAYPLITDKINELVEELTKNEIECRPLICGSMNEQPFWYERFGKVELKNALVVHENGLYLPNNPDLSEENIIKICNIISNVLS